MGVEDGIWVFKNPSIFLENKIIGHTFKMTIENVEKKKICYFRVPIFNNPKWVLCTAAKHLRAQRPPF